MPLYPERCKWVPAIGSWKVSMFFTLWKAISFGGIEQFDMSWARSLQLSKVRFPKILLELGEEGGGGGGGERGKE